MACHEAGASVRIFGDPMQRIYGNRKKKTEIEADNQRWESLKRKAEAFDKLDEPHRWSDGSGALGRWILDARTALHTGGQVDLRGILPPGISIIAAENQSPKHGGYILASGNGKPIYSLVNSRKSILVLATQVETVGALRAFFFRQLPIWEGHVRKGLETLVDVVRNHKGDAVTIAQAVLNFLNDVATGFTPSAYGNILLAEVSSGCIGKRRLMPATLQAL